MGLSERDELLSFLLGRAWPHERLLDAMKFSPDLDVLDVGAGEGRLLNVLANQGHRGQRVGLDPQPGPGVQPGFAEELPFPEASFDVVCMIRMLPHCLNPAQALAEARRVLRPGGQLVVAVQGKMHLQTLWRHAGRPASTRGAEDDVQDIFNASGLSFKRQDVALNIALSFLDAVDFLATYGTKSDLTQASLPLDDTLHLVIYST